MQKLCERHVGKTYNRKGMKASEILIALSLLWGKDPIICALKNPS